MLALICCIGIPSAQIVLTTPNGQAAGENLTTFQSRVNLVLVPVVVRNKQGQAVGGLGKEDFEIFDRGKRQTIASFSVISHTTAAQQHKTALPTQSGDSASNQPATPAANDIAATPQRFIIYLFDDLNVGFSDLAAVRSAMSQHIGGLADTDRAAIYTFSGQTTVDFTTDRDKLKSAASKLRERAAFGHDDAKECPDVSYYLADLIQNHSDQGAHKAAVDHTVACAHVDPFAADAIVTGAVQRQLSFGPQQSRMALRMVRLAIRRLAEAPGERLIILTSPGFFAQTPDAVSDTQTILRLAASAHVTINDLNAHGLYTNQADASENDSRAWLDYHLKSLQADEAVLQDLADGTGGTFIHNNDGFRADLDRLASPPQFSYVLGFSPTEARPDGSFHAIKIRLADGRGLNIEARRGYYALRQDAEKETARLAVDDAVFSRNQINEIPVVLQTGYIEPKEGNPTVTVLVKVDLRQLRFHRAKQRNSDSLTVVSAVFNDDGSYLAGTTKTINLQLRDATLAQADSSVTLHFAFPVQRGAYVVRLVIRDMQSGAMTALTRPEKIT